MQRIQVNAAKPLIQHKPGQTIVNIENSVLSADNSVLEVLEKSPGVFVDQNGTISLNERKGVSILINGQPDHLSSVQLAQMLNTMPSSQVSRIELMTQPPAKYSAEGTAGLINIVLKKPTSLGTNGDVTMGIGYRNYFKYNVGGEINFKNKHLSVYGHYNFNYGKNKFEQDITRDFFAANSSDIQTHLSQISKINISGNNHTVQAGLDYTIDSKRTIGFVANASLVNGANYNISSPVYFSNSKNKLDSLSTSLNTIGYNLNNSGANVHYIWNIDSAGSSLTMNIDYSRFYQSLPQFMSTTVEDSFGNALHEPYNRRGSQPNTINIYAFKVDYVHKFLSKIELQAGIKYSLVNSDNNSMFEILENDQWVDDPNNTNHFLYKENVRAGYIDFKKTFEKGWQAVIGIRGEKTTTHSRQLVSDSSNKTNYLELFPNISLNKKFNPKHVLSLSYSRRIDRPNYRNLNPFIYYVDKYTYQVGNPYLRPQFVRSIELSYNFMKKYSVVLRYNHTNDIMTSVLKQVNSTHTTIQTQENLNKLDNISLSFGIPLSITKWWTSHNTLTGSYKIYDGTYNGYSFNKGLTTLIFNTVQSFTFSKNWKGEFSAMFRSKTINGPSVVDPLGMASIGIQKSLWKRRATIKLNIQDIFQSMNINTNLDFGDLQTVTKFHTFQRTARLTFTWHVGHPGVKVNEYKNTGLKEEKARIKQGNSQ